MNQLNNLKKYTKVVIDTSDLEAVKKFQPLEATTNPTLILNGAQNPNYRFLVDKAIVAAKKMNIKPSKKAKNAIDLLLLNFGSEILKLISGRVSIEIDARLSFDTKKSIEKALYIISLFENNGIERERILIKLAATWEGVRAANELEKQGVHCNLTLIFSPIQAIAAAKAKVSLISPFVGRILDWHTKNENRNFAPFEDPGVLSVKNIFAYYKNHGINTEVMGASFRNKNEILELAGCDLLTIGPKLLAELEKSTEEIFPKIKEGINLANEKVKCDEKNFRLTLNQNQMATEKLSEGIRNFIKDTNQLEEQLLKLMEI